MDFIYDYISVNTFWTILLIVHGLLAVALLGSLTHQAASVVMPVRQPTGHFINRFRAVHGAGYAAAVCVLWIVTFIMGAYRLNSFGKEINPSEVTIACSKDGYRQVRVNRRQENADGKTAIEIECILQRT